MHTLDADNGYTTAIELEVFCPDADDVAELFEDQFEAGKTRNGLEWWSITSPAVRQYH